MQSMAPAMDDTVIIDDDDEGARLQADALDAHPKIAWGDVDGLVDYYRSAEF